MFSPPDPASFNASVYELVRRIPSGRVTTYGRLARLIPVPEGADPEQYARLGARWVGTAMSECPADAPWQRVINAQGKISPRPSAPLQRALLEQEGVEFDSQGQVDLAVYGWPDEKTAGRVAVDREVYAPLPELGEGLGVRAKQ